MINLQLKYEPLLVKRNNSKPASGFRVIPIQHLQDAIDYIIHYNPEMVIVNKSMSDAALMKIRQSVNPWFSGMIIKNDEQ